HGAEADPLLLESARQAREEDPSLAQPFLSWRDDGRDVASGLTPMHPQFDLPFEGFAKVPTPYWYGAKDAGYGDIGVEEFGVRIARETEDIIRSIGPERIASFSAEPVQGAGGLIIPPATYWPEMARICKRHDILLHTDEVVTGFGRLGAWFG